MPTISFFSGIAIKKSRTAVRLIRDWIDLHAGELNDNWNRMETGEAYEKIDPLK